MNTNTRTHNITTYLRSPRSQEEIAEKFSELGSAWNPHQISLFLKLLPAVVQKNSKWQIEGAGKEQIILEAIEKSLAGKPVVPIRLILKSPLLKNIETTAEEILRIALESGRYASPNKKVIKRKE